MTTPIPVAVTRLPTSDQVRAVRYHLGYNQKTLAKLLGLRISQIMAGEGACASRPDGLLVSRFAKAGITFPDETQVVIVTAVSEQPTVYDVRDDVELDRAFLVKREQVKPPHKEFKVTFQAGLNNDFFTHQRVWLAAMDRLIELEPVTGEPDDGERFFWQRERDVMERTFNHLNDQAANGYEMVGPAVADDIRRLNVLEEKARDSYTGLSISKGARHNSLHVMWHHHIGKDGSSLREAIDHEFPKLVVSNVEDRDDWMVGSVESRVAFKSQPTPVPEDGLTTSSGAMGPLDDTSLAAALEELGLGRPVLGSTIRPEPYWPPVAMMVGALIQYLDTLDMRKRDKRKLLDVDKLEYRALRKGQLTRPRYIQHCQTCKIAFYPEVSI